MHAPVSFGSETQERYYHCTPLVRHPVWSSIHDAEGFPLGVILITPVTSNWYYDNEGLFGGTRDCCTVFCFLEASEREDLILSITVSH